MASHGADSWAANDEPRIFGREHVLAETRTRLINGESVVLNGEEGSGKSLIATHLSRQLRKAGRTVVPVRATAREQQKPQAAIKRALRPWYHGERGQHTDTPGDRRLDDVWARVASKSPAYPPILAIDNAHFLDQESVVWLEQLVVNERATLLIAINPSLPAAQSTNAAITALWQDAYLHRVDLPRLSRRDTMRMIDSLTGTNALDLRTKVIIHRESLGNPAIVKEFALLCAETPGSHFAFEGASFPQRLLDMVEYRLRFLDPDQRAALIMLGLLGTTTYDNAKRLATQHTLAALIQRELVERGGHDGDEVFVTRLTTSALLRTEQSTHVTTLLQRALRTTLDTYRRGGQLTPSECLTIAETWIEGTAIPIQQFGAELVADVLTIAAQTANRRGAGPSGAIFARHAIEISPCVGAAIESSRAAASSSQLQAAVEPIEAIDESYRSDELQDSALAEWRRTLSGRVAALSGEPHGTSAGAPGPEDELATINAAVDAMDWESSASMAGEIAFDPDRSPVARARALAVVALSSVALGKPTELAAAQSHSAALHHMLGTMTLAHRSSYGSFALAGVLLRQRIHVLTAHVGFGVDLATIDDKIDDAIDEALALNDHASLALLSVTAAMQALSVGDARSAERELRNAEIPGVFPGQGRWADWIASLHALALCQLGRFDDARARAASVSDKGMDSQTARHRYLAIMTSAAIDHAEGKYEQARIAAMHGIEEFGDTSPVVLTNLIVLAAVSGEPPEHLATWAEWLAESDLPQVRTMGSFVTSLTREDSNALIEPSMPTPESRVPYSFPLVAGSVTTRYGKASTRRLKSSASEQLTGREQEIAALAAAGSTNREIAAKLFLSIRTVESHLYQAKAKLGVRSRRDLSERLERWMSGSYSAHPDDRDWATG